MADNSTQIGIMTRTLRIHNGTLRDFKGYHGIASEDDQLDWELFASYCDYNSTYYDRKLFKWICEIFDIKVEENGYRLSFTNSEFAAIGEYGGGGHDMTMYLLLINEEDDRGKARIQRWIDGEYGDEVEKEEEIREDLGNDFWLHNEIQRLWNDMSLAEKRMEWDNVYSKRNRPKVKSSAWIHDPWDEQGFLYKEIEDMVMGLDW